MKIHSHVMVGDTPYCDWTGCAAGRDIATKSGVTTCGQVSFAAAQRAAKALQPFFCVPVTAVRGDCAGFLAVAA